MRVIFDEKDIECRMYVIRNSYPKDSNNYEFAMTVMYKIGFKFGRKSEKNICMISMTDGMISGWYTKEELAKKLNDDKYGYRILNPIEMTNIVRKAYQKSFID